MENLNIFMHLNQMKLILIITINYINTLDCKDKITPIKCGVGYKDETVYIINPGSTTTAITTTPTEFKIEVKTINY